MADERDWPLETPGSLWWYDDDGVPTYSTDVAIIEDEIVVEGDLHLGDADLVLASDAEIRYQLESGDKSNWDTRTRREWNDGIIRYSIESTFSSAERAIIRQAVDAWNVNSSFTGITWIERPPATSRRQRRRRGRKPGVLFSRHSSGGCFSKIGKHQRRKKIHLQVPGCLGLNVIMHEMGHMVGLRHEQQRTDRSRWTRTLRRNYSGDDRDIDSHDGLNHRFDSIGGYDEYSLMQYFTTAFGRSRNYDVSALGSSRPSIRTVPGPVFLSRRNTGLWTDNGSGVYGIRRWGDRYVYDRRGIDLDEVRVVDVNGDGFDDLLSSHDDLVWWSSQGRSGWIPVQPEGTGQVEGDVADVFPADFDGDGRYDVLRVDGRRWLLQRGDGSIDEVVRDAVRSVAVGDLNADGRTDVVAVGRDGSWTVFFGPDIEGPGEPLQADDMGVRDIRLVHLSGTAGTLDVIAFVDGRLQRSIEGQSEWMPLFAGQTDPLPSHVDSLDELWFGNFDAPARPTEPIDLLFVSKGNDATGVSRGVPVLVVNVLGAGAGSLRGFPAFGLDMEDEAVVGEFASQGSSAILTLNQLRSQLGFSRADLVSVATRYGDLDGPMISDRGPMSSVLSNARNPRMPYFADLLPNERVEFWVWYGAPRSFDVDVFFDRKRSDGRWIVMSSERRRANTHEHFVRIDDAFQESAGEWRVRVVPLGSTLSRETATWFFDVQGEACGDGFEDRGEECDSGEQNSDVTSNACRTTCQAPTCGDGVVDEGEDCDDANADEADACASTCRFTGCGDGIVQSGEDCDSFGIDSTACNADCTVQSCGDGYVNTAAGEECETTVDTSTCDADCTFVTCGDGYTNTAAGEACDDEGESLACDANCTVASCGDGDLNGTRGEECDEGATNSDSTPDACRTDCRLPFCGDGVTDGDEINDVGNPPGCSPITSCSPEPGTCNFG